MKWKRGIYVHWFSEAHLQLSGMRRTYEVVVCAGERCPADRTRWRSWPPVCAAFLRCSWDTRPWGLSTASAELRDARPVGP